jgi:hypothetical protein
LCTLSLLRVDVVDAGSSIRLLAVVVALVVATDGDTVGSGYRWPSPFTELEKADVAGLFLAYGQLAM